MGYPIDDWGHGQGRITDGQSMCGTGREGGCCVVPHCFIVAMVVC